MTIITSKANNLIKKTKKLLQKKYRKDSYLIEGWHLLEEAMQSGAKIEQIFVQEDQAERLVGKTKVQLVTADVLKELTDSPSPQGVVAQLALPKEDLLDFKEGKYLILEDVQDPGNLGTMVRTADAAGWDGVLLSDKSADLYNAKTLRSMQGSHFHLPIWRGDIMEAVKTLQAAGLPLYATTLSKDSLDYKALDKPSSLALVMGNEGRGISQEMAEQADQLIHITMPGQAESLNVAVATGILLFSFI